MGRQFDFRLREEPTDSVDTGANVAHIWQLDSRRGFDQAVRKDSQSVSGIPGADSNLEPATVQLTDLRDELHNPSSTPEFSMACGPAGVTIKNTEKRHSMTRTIPLGSTSGIKDAWSQSGLAED